MPTVSDLNRSFRRPLLALGVLAIAGAAAFFLWPSSHHGKKQTATAQPVLTAEVVAKPMPVEISTIGHVDPIASVAVRSRVDGQIAEVLVGDGQEVKAGDILFKLDDRQAQAQLAQAQGNLIKDRAQLRFAQQDVTRYASLAHKSVASQQQLEQVQANAGALEGTVKADEAQVANLQAQLSYTVIRAPIDGRIGTVHLKTGNTVQSSGATPLATLNQMRPIYVSFAVPQSDLGRIQEAMAKGPVKVTASAPDSGEPPATGEVAYIENAIDSSSNTLPIKAKFANDDDRLWPGQFVNVVVTLRVEPEALVVPSEAVQAGQQGFYVYVIKPADMTAELRTVSITPAGDNQTVITAGVAKGEKVVTTGQLRLKNGTKVRISNTDGHAPAPGAENVASGPGAPS